MIFLINQSYKQTMEIKLQLIGIPKVTFMKKEIRFSSKKTEALLYIIAIKKECTRDTVIELLWEDLNEEDARHNLRNSLYQLKKAFDGNSPILASRLSLKRNPEYLFETDFEELSNIKGIANTSFLSEEFMCGFYINQAEKFNSWIDMERYYINSIFVRTIYSEIISDIEQKKWDEVIHLSEHIIKRDVYDERAYRALMSAYSALGAVNKVIETYSQLIKVLEEELGTTPDRETEKLYDSIILRNKARTERVKNEEIQFFFGRKIELKHLSHLFQGIGNSGNEVAWIYGEAGVGKSYLCKEFSGQLPEQQIYLLKTECYREASGYYLKPWQKIAEMLVEIIKREKLKFNINSVRSLSEFFPEFRDLAGEESTFRKNYAQTRVVQNIENSFLDVFQLLRKQKLIVIVFEDVQWIDNDSFSILQEIMKKTTGLLLLITSRNIEVRKTERLHDLLSEVIPINNIELKCFSEGETIDFTGLVLGDTALKRIDGRKVYKETQGNPFFINQLVKNFQENGSDRIELSKIQDLLKMRFLRVTNEERKVLDIISVFYDEAEFGILTELLRKDEIELLYILETLKNQQIVTERIVDNNVYLRFTHIKLREFIYEEQPHWKKRILHKKIANLLESRWCDAFINPELCHQLIYHYYNAGEKYKELRFSLFYLMFLMEVKIELTYNDLDFGRNVLQGAENTGKQNIHSLFEEWEKTLIELRHSTIDHEDLYRIEVMYKYLLGRFYITMGNYTKGTRLTKQMIELAKKKEDKDYIIKGYKLLIFHGIQVHDGEIVEFYSKSGLSMLAYQENPKEHSLLLRYRGIACQMKGFHNEAWRYLEMSSAELKKLYEYDIQSVTELAMNYYYFGEIKRREQMFTEAMEYYEKAISLCRENGYGEGLERFKTKAGQAALGMGNKELAFRLFQEGIALHEIKGTYWARTIAEGYLALLFSEAEQYSKALGHLKQAEKYCKRIKNPYEEGILLLVKAEIRKAMMENSALDKWFCETLKESTVDYGIAAKEHFHKVGGCYEEHLLVKVE